MKRDILNLITFFRKSFDIPTFVEINLIKSENSNTPLKGDTIAQVRYQLVDGVLRYKFDIVYKEIKNISESDIMKCNPKLLNVVKEYSLDKDYAYLMDTICHELIHVEQLVSGRVLIERRNGVFSKKWNGVDITDVDYSNDPMEIEAYDNSAEVLEIYLNNK